MKLIYYLVKIFLTGAEGKYRAQIAKQPVLTLSDLAKRMSKKNTSLSISDIEGSFLLAKECIKEAIEEGYAVDTIIGMLKYSISGSFDSMKDNFDPSRHKIKANITLNKEFLPSIDKMKVERVQATETGPNIEIVEDGLDKLAAADTLKVGGVAKVYGDGLRVSPNEDGTSTDHGIYFTATDGTETQAAQIITNMPAELVFIVPASLATGDYSLTVRTYETNNRIGKKLLKEEYGNTIQIISG